LVAACLFVQNSKDSRRSLTLVVFIEKGPSGDPLKVAFALTRALRGLQGLEPRFSAGESVAGARIGESLDLCLCACTKNWYNELKQEVRLARNTSVSLTDHFAGFIDRQVETGRYGSASDVVRAGLRLLEEHEAKVKALQDALIEGEKGPFRQFDPDTFLDEMHLKYQD